MLRRAGVDIRVLFALFTLSGFTGLIYESLWSHYLKLFLGAAAFAQSFVLVAFMGGMALGAWLASRWSARLSNLLAAYGWIEIAIGVAAFAFDPLFVGLTQTSLDRVFPMLGTPATIETYKYALCALLIVPQTVLLGMTFPLMSGAIIRRAPEASGHHLALLYFTNSIGAALGALATAFWLLSWWGLPGTMRFGGVLNVALAAAVLWLARSAEPAPAPARVSAGLPAPADHRLARLLLAAAFLTGAASFIYEIVWIRMLSLVLGASFQAFELMLSAFVTGLALGGLWARRRIDRLDNPVRFGGLIQLAMGLAALATLFVYHASYDWMAWALAVLNRGDASYPLFTLFSHAIAFAVMLPATFLAGVTLPLFTYTLLRGGHGERVIGQVYAANTLGAIVGVLIAVHVLMPELGVKLALISGALLDMLLGGWLLRVSGVPAQRREAFAAIAIGLMAAVVALRADVLKPERLASGVFRYGKAQPETERIAFYRDGKTASVAVRVNDGGWAAIVTNGKPDAALRLDPARPPVEDEYTMTLLGALPLLLKPDARAIANIGFGSGMTADVLLSHRGPAVLDTIEIEPAMVAGAHGFAGRIRRPFDDPRSRVHFEDAKTFFASRSQRYDVIVSEPSNPWVNGVASLFTTEFYGAIKHHLAPGGLLVQWVQQYEFDDRLLGSVLAALRENFVDFELWEAAQGDLIVVASADGPLPRLVALPPGEPAFLEQLKRIGITRGDQIAARHLGNRQHLMRVFEPLGAPVNSDFQPFVQVHAARARYVGSYAAGALEVALAPVPVVEMLTGTETGFLAERDRGPTSGVLIRAQQSALELMDHLLNAALDPSRTVDPALRRTLYALTRPRALCGASPPSAEVLEELQNAAAQTLARIPPDRLEELWTRPRWIGCRLDETSTEVRHRFDLYGAIARRDGQQMLERARATLERDAQGDVAWRRFVLVAGLLGAKAMGRDEEAARLWRTYRGKLFKEDNLPAYVVYLVNWTP